MSVVLEIKKPHHHVVSYAVNPSSPISVIDIGYEQKLPHSSYGPAMRQYFLIHFVISGRGFVEKSNRTFPVHAGEAFIIRPDEVCTYRADNDDPWEYCWISFSGNNSQYIMNQTTTLDLVSFRKSGLWALKSAVDTVIEDEIGCLNTLFAVLDSIKTESKPAQTDYVSASLSYIENNYFRDFNVSLLAQTLGVSRSHFTTTFTSRVGCTPYNYLLKTRLEHAKEYLAKTNLSVSEIARSVGFSSLERFSDTFKSYTSLSPLAYRKSLK